MAFQDVEVVIVTPNVGARAELLRIRPVLLAEYRAAFGDRFDATLAEEPSGRWVDVWRWVDRADAEHALGNRAIIPTFDRWEELVTLESVTWAKLIEPTS